MCLNVIKKMFISSTFGCQHDNSWILHAINWTLISMKCVQDTPTSRSFDEIFLQMWAVLRLEFLEVDNFVNINLVQYLNALIQVNLLRAISVHYYFIVEKISDDDLNVSQSDSLFSNRSFVNKRVSDNNRVSFFFRDRAIFSSGNRFFIVFSNQVAVAAIAVSNRAISFSNNRSNLSVNRRLFTSDDDTNVNNSSDYSNSFIIDSENEKIFRQHAFTDDEKFDENENEIANDFLKKDDEKNTFADIVVSDVQNLSDSQTSRRRRFTASNTSNFLNFSSARKRRAIPKDVYLNIWNKSGLVSNVSNAVYASRNWRDRINRRVSKKTYVKTVMQKSNYDTKRIACKHANIDHIFAYQEMTKKQMNAIVNREFLAIATWDELMIDSRIRKWDAEWSDERKKLIELKLEMNKLSATNFNFLLSYSCIFR